MKRAENCSMRVVLVMNNAQHNAFISLDILQDPRTDSIARLMVTLGTSTLRTIRVCLPQQRQDSLLQNLSVQNADAPCVSVPIGLKELHSFISQGNHKIFVKHAHCQKQQSQPRGK